MVLKVDVTCLILLLILFINGGSSKPTPEYPPMLPQLDKCGQQEIEPIFREERIVNGGRAADHSWPWQASLYGEFKTSGGIEYWYQCGGAIVNDQWILTAAHCFVYPDVIQLQKWVIHVGERYNDFLSETVQIKDLESFVIHQEFIYTIRKNDLALLKLSSPLKFNAYVHPICFPPAHEELPEDAFCVVAGFAHNDNRLIERGAPLHQLITPIIPRDNCSSEEFYGSSLKDHMFCSGLIDGKRDTCQGDSGRPLMCLMDNRWTAVGILSYGRNCGIPKKPGVYTKLSSYIPWITKTIHGAKARTALNPSEGITNVKRQLGFDER